MDEKQNRFQLIGRSEAFQQVLESVRQVAPTNISVLIIGESGTGKDLVARAIHAESPRSQKPLLTVNCGAIPQGILESELFGHKRGAFTGAVEEHKGYFEMADKGTLFLDEIGEIALETQVKLLRVLETKEFIRVGSSTMHRVDVRLIAATNKNLEMAVQRGEFRKDLFYRLNTVKIRVPPLRERKEDIPLLADHFARMISEENHIRFEGFSEDAYLALESYHWPGNIRELRNAVERVLVLEKGQKVTGEMVRFHLGDAPLDRPLPVALHRTSEQAERELIIRALLELRVAVEEIRSLLLEQRTLPQASFGSPIESLGESPETQLPMKDLAKKAILDALKQTRGNRKRAAQILGIGERTLYRKLKEYEIES